MKFSFLQKKQHRNYNL